MATKDQQLHHHHPFFDSQSFRNVFCSCHSTSQQAPHLLLPRLLIITSVSSLDPPASLYLPEKSVDDGSTCSASERAAALVQSVGKVRQKTTASQALHMWYVYHRIIVPRYIVCRVALKRPFRYMSEKLQITLYVLTDVLEESRNMQKEFGSVRISSISKRFRSPPPCSRG